MKWAFSGGPVVKTPLAMQRIQVPSLVQKDPTCGGAPTPMGHHC